MRVPGMEVAGVVTGIGPAVGRTVGWEAAEGLSWARTFTQRKSQKGLLPSFA
ncbi:hypothetical protein GCM10009678_53350 [Actinomadura kijaniata]